MQRIIRLFELAECEHDQKKCDRYVELARKLSMRHRVRIPRELKMRICKHCYSYLTPGEISRVRLDGRNIVVTCLNCGGQMRRPYKVKRG